jgi:hypothetical protein
MPARREPGIASWTVARAQSSATGQANAMAIFDAAYAEARGLEGTNRNPIPLPPRRMERIGDQAWGRRASKGVVGDCSSRAPVVPLPVEDHPRYLLYVLFAWLVGIGIFDRQTCQQCVTQLGIPLKHHDAASDAPACASIALRATRELTLTRYRSAPNRPGHALGDGANLFFMLGPKLDHGLPGQPLLQVSCDETFALRLVAGSQRMRSIRRHDNDGAGFDAARGADGAPRRGGAHI